MDFNWAVTQVENEIQTRRESWRDDIRMHLKFSETDSNEIIITDKDGLTYPLTIEDTKENDWILAKAETLSGKIIKVPLTKKTSLSPTEVVSLKSIKEFIEQINHIIKVDITDYDKEGKFHSETERLTNFLWDLPKKIKELAGPRFE